MLGAKSSFADICYNGHFIGTDFDPLIDLSDSLTDKFQEFNAKYIPVFLEKYPTRGDFDRAFNEFCLSKECIDRFGGFPSGNMIDPMYDGHEEDKIRMMIEIYVN